MATNIKAIKFIVLFLVLSMDYKLINAGPGKEKEEISTGKKILGDGNCFYRCISVYLYGHQDHHSRIRQDIIRFMAGGRSQGQSEAEDERSHRYGQLMNDRHQSYNDYLSLHRRNGEWADEPIIQAAADYYGFNIYVSSYVNSQRTRAISEQLLPNSTRLLHLRHDNSHYTCIEQDTLTDAVPSGYFCNIQNVSAIGRRHGAEPYEDSRKVLNYSKCFDPPETGGDGESSDEDINRFSNEAGLNNLNYSKCHDHPKTVGDGKSSDEDINRFSMEDIKRELPPLTSREENEDLVEMEDIKREIPPLTSREENEDLVEMEDIKRELPPLTSREENEDLVEITCSADDDEDKHNEDYDEDYEEIQVNELVNEIINESGPTNTSAVEESKEPNQIIRCRNGEHFVELIQTKLVDFGTVCKVLRARHFCEYFHYFMILNITEESFDVVHLNVTWNFKAICKVLPVRFTNVSFNSLFKNVVFIECSNHRLSENQREEMRRRLQDLSRSHLYYSLTSEKGFYCESLISYIKTGKKVFFEVTNFVVRNPIRGPIIIQCVDWAGYVSYLAHSVCRIDTYHDICMVIRYVSQYFHWFYNTRKEQ